MKFTILLTLLTIAVSSPIHTVSSQNQNINITPKQSFQLSRPTVFAPRLPQCPQVIPIPRIVGGSATPALAPYLVALIDANNFFRCTGTLISSRWIISAAHCQINTQWKAVLGAKDRNSGTFREIKTVITHPDYGTPVTNDNDITAIEITEDAPSDSAFALINDNDNLPEPESFVKAAGYGATSEGATSLDLVLRSVDLPVVAPDVCGWAYGNSLTENMICAGSAGCDACQGDSGGPLLQFDSAGEGVLVGVVSFGVGCARPGFPGVNVDIARYVAWLGENGVEFKTGQGEQLFG